MNTHPLFIVKLSLLIILQCTTTTLAQSAPAPAPSGPTNVTKILEKGGQFTTLIRLMGLTQVGNQINNQLNNSNNGLTIFAPTDNAFNSLQSGTLNSLTDQEKTELIQFHIVPSPISMTQFQTVSNPLRTQAGDSRAFQFPLNVTTSGNSVNITTVVTNATVNNAIYIDNQLFVYQVVRVCFFLWPCLGPNRQPRPLAQQTCLRRKMMLLGLTGLDW